VLGARRSSLADNGRLLDVHHFCFALIGYPCELHYVTTDDGYILNTYRIPSGKGTDLFLVASQTKLS